MNKHRFVLFLGLALVGDACTGSLAEENHPCPCASGWTCCPSANVCVTTGSACPAPDGGPMVTNDQDASVQEASSADDAQGVVPTQDATVPAPPVDAAVVTPEVDAMPAPGSTLDPDCGAHAVSFSGDVMPIFQGSCTLSAVCHGQMNNAAEENLYLGDNRSATPPSTVFSGLVNVRSEEDPSMNLVTPGDAYGSYLWHKLIGDQNTNSAIAAACAQAPTLCSVVCNKSMPCGDQQPYLSVQLPADELCTIETWIDEGAPNN